MTPSTTKPAVHGLKQAAGLPNHPPPYTAGERLSLQPDEIKRYEQITGLPAKGNSPDGIFHLLYGTTDPDEIYRHRQYPESDRWTPPEEE